MWYKKDYDEERANQKTKPKDLIKVDEKIAKETENIKKGNEELH